MLGALLGFIPLLPLQRLVVMDLEKERRAIGRVGTLVGAIPDEEHRALYSFISCYGLLYLTSMSSYAALRLKLIYPPGGY